MAEAVQKSEIEELVIPKRVIEAPILPIEASDAQIGEGDGLDGGIDGQNPGMSEKKGRLKKIKVRSIDPALPRRFRSKLRWR
jgi:hypothetical protein